MCLKQVAIIMDDKKVDDFLGDLSENDNNLGIDTQELFPEEELEPKKDESHVPYHKDEKLQRYIDRQVEKRLKETTPQ